MRSINETLRYQSLTIEAQHTVSNGIQGLSNRASLDIANPQDGYPHTETNFGHSRHSHTSSIQHQPFPIPPRQHQPYQQSGFWHLHASNPQSPYQQYSHEMSQPFFGTNPSFENAFVQGVHQPSVTLPSMSSPDAHLAFHHFYTAPAQEMLPARINVHKNNINSGEPYAKLIGKALKSATNNQMTLREVYRWFEQNTDKAKKGSKGWQNSVRHNLSMNAAFVKVPNHQDELRSATKQCIWSLSKEVLAGAQILSTTRYRKQSVKKSAFPPDSYRITKPSTAIQARQSVNRDNDDLYNDQGYDEAMQHSYMPAVKQEIAYGGSIYGPYSSDLSGSIDNATVDTPYGHSFPHHYGLPSSDPLTFEAPRITAHHNHFNYEDQNVLPPAQQNSPTPSMTATNTSFGNTEPNEPDQYDSFSPWHTLPQHGIYGQSPTKPSGHSFPSSYNSHDIAGSIDNM